MTPGVRVEPITVSVRPEGDLSTTLLAALAGRFPVRSLQVGDITGPASVLT